MKPYHFLSQTLFLLSAFLVVLTGCKKDEDPYVPGENENSAIYKSMAADAGRADFIENDIDLLADEAARGNFGSNGPQGPQGILNPCATVTMDTTVTPHVITIDFGPVNCLGNDGHYRRGQIIITHSGPYWAAGSVKTLSFNGYHVDDNAITGTRSVTNNGQNAGGNYNWTIDVVNFTITKPNGDWFSRNSNRNREMIQGYGTMNPWDDVYLITGGATAQKSNGHTMITTITSALRKEVGCKWIVSGTMDMAPNNLPVRAVDFGTGTCDNIATVTINGVTHTITLP
ncbi:MAG: hypothetical protein ACR2GN_06135 [Bacteroidia bacterium]